MSTNTSNNNTKQNIEEYTNRLYIRSNNLEKTSKNSEVYEWLDYGLSNENVTKHNGNTNNIKKHKLLKKKFIQNCINWAAKYHAQSPYLYEITLDETTITRNNNAINNVAASNNINDNATNPEYKNIDNVGKYLNSNYMSRYNAGKILYKYAYIAGKQFKQDDNVINTILDYMLAYYDSDMSLDGKYDEFFKIISMAVEGKIRDDKIITTSHEPDKPDKFIYKFIKEFTENFDKAMQNNSYTPDNMNVTTINSSKNTSASTRNNTKKKKNKLKKKL